MQPCPTVEVFGKMIAPDGSQIWQRYSAAGDDHRGAAVLAVRAWSGGWRLEELLTFDGLNGQRWTPGVEPAK